MLEVDVCLVVVSTSTTLADLAKRIGVGGADGSHDRGAPHLLKSRGRWSSTVWQNCSTRPRGASIDDHLADLLAQVPPERVATAILPPDSTKYISIGVFSTAQIPTVTLSERALSIAAAYGAPIELRWYSPAE
jgi:hypothetical protein